jgi:hypothetical protein
LKSLLLVHVEESFRDHFPNAMLKGIVDAIKDKEFDEVIHFTSFIADCSPVYEIDGLIDEVVQWGWGYTPEMFNNEKQRKHVIPASGHIWTYVPKYLRDEKVRLRSVEITLGGGLAVSCLADMESVLKHLNLPYQIRKEFTFG